MENRREPVKSKALAIVEKLPILAVQPSRTNANVVPVIAQRDPYPALPPTQAGQAEPPWPKYKSWEWTTEHEEKPVKILSYVGNLPNQFGNEGDFYVDETTNMLYGPKKAGVWPENGVLATGLCKRTWVAFNRMRVPSKAPEHGLGWRMKAFTRFLLPIRSLFRLGRRQKPAA